MRSALILGILAGSMLLPAADKIQIGIRLHTPPTMPPILVKAFIDETQRHWDYSSLELHWHNSRKSCERPDNRLVVVRMLGECAPLRSPPESEMKTLGYTHVSDNQVLPFVDVDCKAVASALSRRHAFGVFLPMNDYARALASVLTHEMVHALTASRVHSTAGVMQIQLSPDDLVVPGSAFPPDVVEGLEDALRVHLTEFHRRSGESSPRPARLSLETSRMAVPAPPPSSPEPESTHRQ